MMLGKVVGADAEPIVGFDQLQPIFIERAEGGAAAAVDMVEATELHRGHPAPGAAPSGGGRA